ncbi:MAG: hypothetical protein VX453_00940 [Acidobacteriota bacterium]|nr:hypothetical protein [Acidobacteriota bacterium]
MLRECVRVLKPGGRIAGYVIQVPAGVTEAQERRAAELGPSEVVAPSSFEALTQAAGLTIVLTADVTEAFRSTCAALAAARRDLENELRIDEGDDFYEEERRKKNSMLQGIDEGILRRSLVVASKQNK